MIFKNNPGNLKPNLEEQGYVLLKDVLTDDFKAYLREFFDTAMREAALEADDWKITGKKRQFVFDFRSEDDADEFRQGMAELTGIPIPDFTISERHLKVYDDHANSYPAPHKDRSASHYSIGLPVHLPKGSTVCVFPDLDPGPNLEHRAKFLEDDNPEAIKALYDGPEARMLHESFGDVIVFLGSALYHERVKGAGTAVLYIKANGEGDDPLGENIYGRATVAV